MHEVIQQSPTSLGLISALLEKMPESLHTPHLLDGQTPLHYVLRYGGKESSALSLLTLLVTKGADLEQQGRDHLTPLDRAMENHQDLLFAYLIQQGAGREANPILALKYGKILKEDNPAYPKFGLLLERNPNIAWQMTLEHLLPLPSPSEKGTLIQGATLGKRLLPDYLKGKLLTEKGELISHNKSGRHNVGYLGTRIQGRPYGIYFKEYPELPGLEEAVGLLTRDLIGFGAPYSELFSFEGKPVLASQAIQGSTLSHILKESSQNLQLLDSESLSSLILAAMLVNPEDGKPDNYIFERLPTAKESYRLIGIDNDHAFVPAIAKEQRAGVLKGESKVQVKTILYSLDQMQSFVPSSVRDRFLEINAGELLERWLRDLRQRADQYNLLWPEAKKLDLVTKKECYIGIPFQKGAIEQLYQKFIRLQNLLYEKPHLTHLQLLCQLEPLLGHRYKAMYNPSLSVYQRFLQVDAPFYKTVQEGSHLTVTSSGMILKSMNIPLKESLIEKAKKESAAAMDYYPHTALKELKEIQQRHSEDVLFTLLKKAGVSITLQKDALHRLALSDRLAAVLREVDFKDVSEPDQQAVLDIIKGKSFQELTLRNMKVLTDKYITTFIPLDHLKIINLGGATALTETSLAPIAERAPALEQLNLSSILGLRSFAKKTLLREEHLIFPSLISLNLSGCSGLEAVRIEAPLLTHIKVDQCPRLKTWNIRAPQLSFIDVSHNPWLTDEKLDVWVDLYPNLNGFKLEGNPQITNAKMRETFGKANDAKVTPAVDYGLEGAKNRILQSDRSFIDIGYQSLGDERFKEISSLLTPLSSIKSLKVAGNRISAQGIEPLIKILQSNAFLLYLDLGGNNLGAEGIRVLADTLKNDTALQELYLGANNIGDEGAFALSETLKVNTSLRKLALGNNKIGDEGTFALSEALKVNTSLIELTLGNKHIGSKGKKALIEALHVNRYLPKIFLGYGKEEEEIYRLAACNYMVKEFANSQSVEINIRGDKSLIGSVVIDNYEYDDDSQPPCSVALKDEGVQRVLSSLPKKDLICQLNLGVNALTDEGVKIIVEILKNNVSLYDLNLESNTISAQNLALLTKFTHLTTLNLRKNLIKEEKGILPLGKLGNLHTLNLAENHFGSQGAKAIAANLKAKQPLKQLNLEGNNIGDEGTVALSQGMKGNSTLKELNLRNNDISGAGAMAIAHTLEDDSILTTLNLHGNKIGSQGATALSKSLISNFTLTWLDLEQNNLMAIGGAALAEVLKKNITLIHLDLGNNNINDEGAEALGNALGGNKNLRHLNLNSNNIGDDGVNAIVQALKVNTTLDTLNLEKNKITDVGAKALKQVLKENTTRHTILHLNGNKISSLLL